MIFLGALVVPTPIYWRDTSVGTLAHAPLKWWLAKKEQYNGTGSNYNIVIVYLLQLMIHVSNAKYAMSHSGFYC